MTALPRPSHMAIMALALMLLLTGLVAAPVRPALAAEKDTVIEFDATSGLFRLMHRGYPVVSTGFVFWTGNWRWAAPSIKSRSAGFGQIEFSGEGNEGLRLQGKGSIVKADTLQWVMKVDPGMDPNLFGGIAFRFDSIARNAGAGWFEPQIEDSGEGWNVTVSPGASPVRFSVTPRPASILFERGQKGEIRLYFAEQGKVMTPGTYTMTVELPPEVAIAASAGERLAQPAADWYENPLGIAQFPVDLSDLNAAERPAGKRGFLEARDGKLFFPDGTRARFWGTNLTAYALMRTSRDDVVRQARRLSRMGFNLVRFHHMESAWVKPNMIERDEAGVVTLNEESMQAIDWWIKALADEGIYVWFDLEVGRIFAPEGISDVEEMYSSGAGPQAKGYAYISAEIEQRMKSFNAQILNRVNQFTGLAYKADPRIAFFLITNENDLTHHFGNLFLPDKNRPKLSARFMEWSAAFAKAAGLDPNKTWTAWTFGPAKLFLNELEHRFNLRMIDHLRSTGAKVPIITTNSFSHLATVAGVPSLTDGNVIAVNTYTRPGALDGDPAFAPTGIDSIAMNGVAGKPVTVTEWNTGEFPNYERSALPEYIASIAALQDWDALMVYAHSQGNLGGQGNAGVWETGRDPAMVSNLAAGALLFREQHVRPGDRMRYLAPAEQDFIDKPLSPYTSRAIRTLTETSRWRLDLPKLAALPWFDPPPRPEPGETVTDLDADFSTDAAQICADTGDFCRNWRKGIFTVDTRLTQSASGWIGGERIDLADVGLAMSTRYGSVAVQALDRVPIAESRKILVSLAAQTLVSDAKPPATLVQPVVGRIEIKAAPGLQAYALFDDGLARPVASIYADGRYRLDLDERLRTLWLILKEPD